MKISLTEMGRIKTDVQKIWKYLAFQNFINVATFLFSLGRGNIECNIKTDYSSKSMS